ncbi:cold-shock protein [Myroides pelagicus]|uniref:Cold-shock protein n=1 Tax=Myroides pelagicus TaxID=270914 RepID=A0A7K1GJG5_9FLAO|nr:cold shock domain-containing protein [Myroides pelagicus]MEC4112972.1 cold shock domain-containing protein [Myroides pelagicus]MTH29025.1 cold-shock protein [Myroides pelagicus]
MQTGVIKFFNEEKGFGFITNDETKQDIFVHITGLNSKNIEQGNKVSYIEEKGKKGLIATEVTIIEG